MNPRTKWSKKWDMFCHGHLTSQVGPISLSAVYDQNRSTRDDDDDEPPTWTVHARMTHSGDARKGIWGHYEVELSKTVPARPGDTERGILTPDADNPRINEAAQDLIQAIIKMTSSLPKAEDIKQDDGGWF